MKQSLRTLPKKLLLAEEKAPGTQTHCLGLPSPVNQYLIPERSQLDSGFEAPPTRIPKDNAHSCGPTQPHSSVQSQKKAPPTGFLGNTVR